MFIAFMPLHILLCDEVLSYFVLCVEVIHSLNLDLNQKNLNLYKAEFKEFALTRLPDPIPDKVFALTHANPAGNSVSVS
jgi:hypothetical protein